MHPPENPCTSELITSVQRIDALARSSLVGRSQPQLVDDLAVICRALIAQSQRIETIEDRLALLHRLETALAGLESIDRSVDRRSIDKPIDTA